MNRMMDQVVIGLWGAMAVGMGIMSKSWGTFFSIALVGAFFAVGNWSAGALRSQRVLVRRLGVVVFGAFVLVIVAGFAFAIERLYLVNGRTYPAWLAKRDLGTVSHKQLWQLPECQGKGAEIFEKEDGLAVIRCGGMMWYDGHTLVAKIKEGQQ